MPNDTITTYKRERTQDNLQKRERTQELLLYLLFFVEHSTQVHLRNVETTIRLLIQEHTHTIGIKLQITTNGKNRTSH